MRVNRIKLVSEMIRQDITQTALAKKSGISRTTICFIKNGKSCSDKTAEKIAKALNMRVEDLIEMGSD